ncbi:RF-1 domain-containing protein [Chaetomium sp. MPI-SDFR-AT-0129]|nr:RF-1 domain-containing protein [Chaetomium sp. MPI-SDFR-AT-0129]
MPPMIRFLTRLRMLFGPLATPNYSQSARGSSSTITNPSKLTSSFTTSTSIQGKQTQLPPRPKHPPESEIDESFLKGSGPGGQKINKTSSAVQLKHLPTGIVVKSQATRSRSQNRKIARDLLALRLDELARGPQSRAAAVSDLKKKRADSKSKKARRKYRKLAEGQTTGEGDIGEEGAEGIEGRGVEWDGEGGINEEQLGADPLEVDNTEPSKLQVAESGETEREAGQIKK